MNIKTSEFNPYYTDFVAKSIVFSSISEGFLKNIKETKAFFLTLPKEKLNYSYEVGKWSIKDILQHLIDVERIYSYRALCISRGDLTKLPGFDENEYANQIDTTAIAIEDLISEFETARNNTISLFKRFTESDLIKQGTASENLISVRAIGSILLGHEIHHLEIIKERYL